MVPGEHELQTQWTFWYERKPNKKMEQVSFQENLQQIGTFKTIEGFARYYAFLSRPSELKRDANYFLFRHGITPGWETCPQGGCWILKIRKRTGMNGRLWEELLFAAIGELFEEPDVVGVAIGIRSREDVLSVWNADNTKNTVRWEIGEKMRNLLHLDQGTPLEYKDNKTSMKDRSTFRNAKSYIFAATSNKNGGTTPSKTSTGRPPKATPPHA
eukprot:TRINITY_DN2318_c0_g1_i3.p1 TRINITY_DN2318_c0_g1~~TRINITY_DN2318_c0_g1_i3.p1  ORF type:complete len:214 (-),score=49.14 TRINITY_DN2318_c0_g1_i3:134-775(-)